MSSSSESAPTVSFAGQLAVVTGGATGMGRELVLQLAADGCHVATCDRNSDELKATVEHAANAAPGVQVTAHQADVSDESEMARFAAEVADRHASEHINLLFNNAGIGGGGSFVSDDRAEWETTFDVCWRGVYLGCRTFLPMLMRASSGHIVNTSSVNGFWATLGTGTPNSAYSAAKFAVKGFTEALITDLRLNAPHIRASVVMPGHIGTSIVLNSMRTFGRDPKELTAEQVAEWRERMAQRGLDLSAASDEDIRQGVQAVGEAFRDAAPMTAADAASVILHGVRSGTWRILVGDDAVTVDRLVRDDPEGAYEPAFNDLLKSKGIFNFAI
jgi:NAD(P)-dependent dehydrogenase (short-subunit alcohol dehydrogenase family)